MFDFLSEHKVGRAEIEFEGKYQQKDEDVWDFQAHFRKTSVWNAGGEAVTDADLYAAVYHAVSDADFLDVYWEERVGFSRDFEKESWGQTASGTIILDVAARTVRINGTANVFPPREMVEKKIDESWDV